MTSGPRRLLEDPYRVAGVAIFLLTAVLRWKPYVRGHEGIYLIGSRRVLDPELLANDLTWSVLPPTTFVYDHLMAALGLVLPEFPLLALGRIVTWALLAAGLVMLGRQLRLPPWSLVVGTLLFLLWDQSLFTCGRMLEGFQPKSLAYPLTFLALAFTLRGEPLRAGAACGVATAFHIIDGGWACLAIFVAMLCNPREFPRRDVALFLLATAPFIAPLVLVVGFWHVGGVEPAARALMDEVYVTFAQPNCVDPTFFMKERRWFYALTTFPLSVGLLLCWPDRRGGRFVGVFLAVLVAVWAAGMLASAQEVRWFQKLFPYQLAASYPALFLFVVALGFFGVPGPRRRRVLAVWLASLVIGFGLLDEDDAMDGLFDLPDKIAEAVPSRPISRYGDEVSPERLALYAWIRENTPRDAVFVTPFLSDFWIYAERAQVASFRHPPHDQKLIEWKERLEALNDFQPFEARGADIREELNVQQRDLDAEGLVRLRDRYGATHHVVRDPEVDPELADHVLYRGDEWIVYGLAGLEGEGAASESDAIPRSGPGEAPR